MKYLLSVFCFCFLVACASENKQSNTPSSEDIASAAPPAAPEQKPEIDFKALFKIAEQESLELYNEREQLLLSAKNVGKLKADSFMKALLSPTEEGSTRRIEYGSNYGITGQKDQEFFIVLEDNLPDDSIQSDIRFFELRKTKQAWTLASVTSVWKCYPKRGHQNYSNQVCL